MQDLSQPLLQFIEAHQNWAAAIMFITAFGESFAFISLFFPGTTLLIAAGALTRSGALPYLPVAIGAVAGAVMGDAICYWLGRRFGGGVARVWPFSRNPDLLPSGVRFFRRHGATSVFIGRFFGPIRAVIPLAAGIMQMARGPFWLANVTSALVWAPMLLFIGGALGKLGDRLIGSVNTVALVFGGLTVVAIACVAWAAFRAAQPKP